MRIWKKLLTAAAVGMTIAALTASSLVTPPKTTESTGRGPREDEEEEEEIQPTYNHSPTGFYDYDRKLEEYKEQYDIRLATGVRRGERIGSYASYTITERQQTGHLTVSGRADAATPRQPFEQRMDRVRDRALAHIASHPEDAGNEYGILLRELYEDLIQHPPMDEEEEKIRRAIEMMNAKMLEKGYER